MLILQLVGMIQTHTVPTASTRWRERLKSLVKIKVPLLDPPIFQPDRPRAQNDLRLKPRHPPQEDSADTSMPVWKRLIGRTSPPEELIPLVEAVFTSKDEIEMIRHLGEGDAQEFIDVVHEVCFAFFSSGVRPDRL
jgi:hypothetical protein